MNTRQIDITATVLIHARPDAPADWISRVTGDFPYKHWDGSPLSESEGLHMLADNAVRNGVSDASRLDGWGDLAPGVVEMEVLDVDAEVVQ